MDIVPVIKYFLDGDELLEVSLLGWRQVLHSFIKSLVDIAEGTMANFFQDLVLLTDDVSLVQARREEFLLLDNGLNFVVYLFGIIFGNLLYFHGVLLGSRFVDL